MTGATDDGMSPMDRSTATQGQRSPRPMNLVDIFATRTHAYQRLHDLVAEAIARAAQNHRSPAATKGGALCEIDLQGGVHVLDRPLEIADVQRIILRNGTLVAGPDFPHGDYLIACNRVVGVSFLDLFLECAKRANGMRFEAVRRARVEDCHILHQRDYGIHSGPTSGGHALDIFKCHIIEYVYSDGYPGKASNYGIIPAFDVDANRMSTGIFPGQADTVVADCNINLCRTGIRCSTRSNRIIGNHITGGGSQDLDIFQGIAADSFDIGPTVINHNYIDNCTLWVTCDDRPGRGALHVTDNLFYRGYNHPSDGRVWSHIVIDARKPASRLGPMHVCDNLFYNQDENLNAIKPRILLPLRVHAHPDPDTGDTTGLDHTSATGFCMENNQFTNKFPTFVQPMGTTVTKTVAVHRGKADYVVTFREDMPIGVIAHASAELCALASGTPRPPILRKLLPHAVQIELPDPFDGDIRVTATTRPAGGDAAAAPPPA